MKRIFVSLFTLFCLIAIIAPDCLVLAAAAPANTTGPCNDVAYYGKIRELWTKRKPTYISWINGSASTLYNFYNIEIYTNNLLVYAGHCKDYYILDELVDLYMLALNTLDETDKYAFYYFPMNKRRSIHPLDKKYKMWLDTQTPVGSESILVSSQFLYLISNAVNIIAGIEAGKRSAKMKSFVQSFVPVLQDHYDRWILAAGPFQVRGWGCMFDGKYVETGMNHKKFLEKKLNKTLGNGKSPKYCNSVTDTDMWIVAGVVNFLAAHKKDSNLVPIPTKKYNSLLEYAKLGARTLESRISYKTLKNFSGQSVQGANFDLGVWDDYPDYKYSGYQGATYPKDLPENRATNVGWDLSHARRFVHVFMALAENRDLLGLGFPSADFMTKLANQLVYGAFNGDFKKPLFATYMDGTNGWYRIGYSDREGFGYGPRDMSIAVLTGGYGFWMKYNNDIERLLCSLMGMLNSDDPKVRNHVIEHYEKFYWSDYKRAGSINFKDTNNSNTQSRLIQLLPSLCFSVNAYKGCNDQGGMLSSPRNLHLK